MIRRVVMTVYLMVDRLIPYAIKLTFPLWALPVLCFMLASRTIRIWRSILEFIWSVVYPNTPPVLGYAILKGNGQYLRTNREEVLIQQFYDYTSRSKKLIYSGFMNLVEMEADSTVVELECDNLVGLEYLANSLKKG